MTTAQEYDLIRSPADTESVYDGRAIPAGMRGAVLGAKPDGSILAEFAFVPQTADSDGDFVQGVLAAGEYEVIQAYVQERCPEGPFAALIKIATTYLYSGAARPETLRGRASDAHDPEMSTFKEQLRELILHPERLPDGFFNYVQHDCGSDEALMRRLWSYLYDDEPVAEPGTDEALRAGGAGA